MSCFMCKCGSYAINDDPVEKECDRCLWKNRYLRSVDEIIRLNGLMKKNIKLKVKKHAKRS